MSIKSLRVCKVGSFTGRSVGSNLVNTEHSFTSGVFTMADVLHMLHMLLFVKQKTLLQCSFPLKDTFAKFCSHRFPFSAVIIELGKLLCNVS